MSTIFIAAVLISIVAILCLMLVSINNKQIASDLVSQFNKLGQEMNLYFSKKEILGNLMIGLDDLYKKFLILKKSEDKYDSYVINLNEVKSCSKRKIYERVNIGTMRREIYENCIDKIILEFDYSDNREPFQVSFFESRKNPLLEMSAFEQKARDWEIILNKSINREVKKIA